MRKHLRALILLAIISLSFSGSIKSQFWIQKGSDINGLAHLDRFGWSVSINGEGNIFVGGSTKHDFSGSDAGSVMAYHFNGTNWVQLGNTIYGQFAGDEYGNKTTINGSGHRFAASSTYHNSFRGHTRVYELSNGIWTQLGADIDGESTGDHSGVSLSMNDSGNIIAIGATGNNAGGNNAGHARVFQLINGSWVQLGNDIDGQLPGVYTGSGVSLNSAGTRLAVGERSFYTGTTITGQVRVFDWDGNNWNLVGNPISGEGPGDLCGSAVALDKFGNTLIVAEEGNSNNGTNAGKVRVFEFNGSSWIQVGSSLYGGAGDDRFGRSVDISKGGDTIIVGAPLSDPVLYQEGESYIYQLSANTWSNVGQVIPGEDYGDQSGHSLSMNDYGNIIAIGAYRNDGVPFESGHVRVYEYCKQTDSTLTVAQCNSYNSPLGNLLTESGIYTETLTNAVGCDSIVTIELTIWNESDTTLVIQACDSFQSENGINYFQTGNYTEVVSNHFGCDSSILIDLTINHSKDTSFSKTSCQSYVSPSGNIYNQSASIIDTVTTVFGCDSIITIDLSIINIDLSISANIDMLKANQDSANYQWLDCDSNYMLITGETNQTFSPPSHGNYAVEITLNGCTDTSECGIINSIKFSDNFEPSWEVFPNPTNGALVIESTIKGKARLELFTLQGNSVDRRYCDDFPCNINFTQSPGVYLLSMNIEDQELWTKVILQ